MNEELVKRSRALLTAALPLTLLAVTLTGCSVGGAEVTEDAAGVACAAPGDASKSITVEGEFGAALELSSKTPVAATELQRSTLIAGTGDVFAEDQTATASYTIFNGKTGEVVNQQLETDIPNNAEQLTGAEWAYEAVRCGTVGQRAAIVVPVSEALGGADPAEAGIEGLAADDSFVIVFDFTEAEEQCDTLTPRDEKYPEVDLGDGSTEPVITIPECMEAPAELELEVLVEGDGPTVADGDSVMTNYVGVFWNGAERFDGNWTAEGIEFSTAEGALIEGFRQAMIGQKIGSTILVTMPSELGYNDGEVRTFVLQLVSEVSGS
jgi:peptidylprolyl isomerase